ncbi:G-patch domain and KOW motifs-containing protein [Mobula birostris]|uniref:G-patch domain and KOW motifs-containing protein n=1 Tax=Mobula birostris TaxID=1983395 RepID=UPI003B2858C9
MEQPPAPQREEPEAERGPVSFGFTRTVSKPRAKEAVESEAEKETVTGVEGGEVLSLKPREKPQELIVPLIRKNRWHKPDSGAMATEEKEAEEQEDPEVLSKAVQELIEESQRYQEKWKEGSRDDGTLSIPLLMQNQAPRGYEDGEKVNVELRPESSTAEDYESVPVEAYGMAMLRGMGWKEGEGIGRTFKQDVKPLEQQLRPKGLGLGADRSVARDLEPSRPTRPPKPGEERPEEEPQGPALGRKVQIRQGPHRDLYGQIEGLDPDNARVVVRLALGNEVVTVSQYGLNYVSAGEYQRYSRDLSRLSAAHRESQRQQEAARGKEVEKEKRTEHRERKRKHEASAERDRKRDKRPSSPTPRRPCWLRSDLLVRLIDRRYQKGAYYNCKVTIEDVLSTDSCVCRTDGGRLLEGIKQSMLETVIPKSDSAHVMVVLGKHRGAVGRILKRDRAKCQALVQLQHNEEHLLQLDYDTICHYVGASGSD